MPLENLTASEAARRIQKGELTAEALVRACLARIEAREPEVFAFASLDPSRALEEARVRDKSRPLGPLHGVPFAVKDVFDTADLPTGMGSPIYQGHCPKADAACVALLRAAGAIVLGKTVTCEFAGFAPGPTRNPKNLKHTPGGSSSGSAAAVADFMVPAGLGTQTGGSVIRPAAYCGIIGYKPSFGLISRSGLKLAAESLDTIGLLARSIEDIGLFASVLQSWGETSVEPQAPRKIGLCRTFLWPQAQSETKQVLEEAAARLSVHVAVSDFDLPEEFAGLTEARDLIDDFERARALAWEWHHHGDLLTTQMAATIIRGRDIPFAVYIAAQKLAATCREKLTGFLADYDVLIAPATIGEAPEGLASTGTSTFQGLWNLLHVPSLCLPAGRGPAGLPVAIQLVAPRYEDERLLRTASWTQQKLAGG
jgi:Asp-tRNA(Asn)/Glu-tRNA(Gln) amidotransferase A subunit family amidase